ncbi:MAG TPA: hypothetical protein VFT87_05395 [Candidatus Saccharimonadales bacterium]|nr:hypothetical protein [Candidatus Saccharimonadales bacterium]
MPRSLSVRVRRDVRREVRNAEFRKLVGQKAAIIRHTAERLVIDTVDWLVGYRRQWPLASAPSVEQKAYLEFAARLAVSLCQNHVGMVPVIAQQRLNERFVTVDGVLRLKG